MKALWTEIYPAQRLSREKPRKRLRKVSRKRRKENVEYARVKREWKEMLVALGAWFCRRCIGVPSDAPHHYRGRAGKLLCEPAYFVPLCPACHRWVNDEPKEARKMGWLCPVGDWGKQP